MWVITRSVNQYDQYGDYFECVFDHKPFLRELIRFFGNKELAKHVLAGGGRISDEGTWYFLTEMKSGEQYTHST